MATGDAPSSRSQRPGCSASAPAHSTSTTYVQRGSGSFLRTSSDLRTTLITRRSLPFLVTRFLQALFSAGESCDDGAAAPGSAPCGTTTSYSLYVPLSFVGCVGRVGGAMSAEAA